MSSSDHAALLAETEAALARWAELAPRRPGLQASLDKDAGNRYLADTYVVETESDRRWVAELRSRLLTQEEAKALREGLAALDEVQRRLPELLRRVAAVLEGLGLDSTPVQRVALSLDPHSAGEALVVIGRARAKVTGRPAHPTADWCLLPGFHVRWDGPTQLEPLLWHLLHYLLKCDHYPLSVAALQESVWGGKDILPKTVANAISRLNNDLERIRFPWSWSVSKEHVYRYDS
jgi:hypothetical protein